MSAWYVLAALGRYPVCPGSGQWVETTPLLTPVGTWRATSAAPRTQHAVSLQCPDSLRITPCPVFDDWRMQSDRDRMSDTSAQWEGRLRSQTVRHVEVKTSTDKKVTYLTQPAPQYTENGPEGMVDNILASTNYRIGGWQGWQQDMVAVVELDNVQSLRHIGLDCLEHMRSWIFFPASVRFEVSLDGQQWQPFGEARADQFPAVHARQEEMLRHEFAVRGSARAKFVKVTARNFGPLPAWHVSAGQQAWLFADEIIIK